MSVFRDRLVARYSARLALLPPQRITGLTIIAGAALGLVVSISSIDAGAIGVTVLFLLYPKLPDGAHRRLRYRSMPFPLARRRHWALASWRRRSAGVCLLIIGSVPGILLGSYAAVHAPERMLRLVLAGTLVVVATAVVRPGLPSTDVVGRRATTNH